MPGPFDIRLVPVGGETQEEATARFLAEQDAARSARLGPSFAEMTLEAEPAILASPLSNETLEADPAGAMALRQAERDATEQRFAAERARRQEVLRNRPRRYADAEALHAPDETSLGEMLDQGVTDLVPEAVRPYARGFVPALTEPTLGEGGLDILDERFSPLALATRALPFSDELAALGSLAANKLRPDRPDDYDHSQDLTRYEDPTLTYGQEADRFDTMFREAAERSPRSAALGETAQMIAATPFIPIPARIAGLSAPAAVDASTLGLVGRGATRAGYEAGMYGGIHGFDTSEHRPAAALADAVSWLGDDQANAGASLARLGHETFGAGVDTLSGAGEYGAIGAATGGGMGVLQAGARRALVSPRSVQALQRREAGALLNDVRSAPSAADAEELALYTDRSIPEDVETLSLEPPRTTSGPRLAADEIAPAPRRSLREMMLDPFTGNPDVMRLRAAGLHTIPQQRAAVNIYGPGGLSRRLDAYGILREGEIIPIEEAQRRATLLREDASGRLREAAANASREGVMIDGARLADDLDAMAAEYERIPDADSASIASDIRAQAQRFRDYIPEANPADVEAIADEIEVLPERITAPDRLLPPNAGVDEYLPRVTDADVTMEPPIELTDMRLVPPTVNGNIPWEDFQGAMRSQGGRGRAIYRGTATNPQEQHAAAVRTYRLMNEARDRAYADQFGEQALADYRLDRDRFATSAHVSPPTGLPRENYTAPVLSRRMTSGAGATTGAAIGGAVAGAPGIAVGGALGSFGGFLAGNRLPAYEHSILAAFNSARHGSLSAAMGDIGSQLGRRAMGIAERDAAIAAGESLWQRVQQRMAIDPLAFGEYSTAIRDAMSRGVGAAWLGDLFDSDPEAATAIEAAAQPYTEDEGDLFTGDEPTDASVPAAGDAPYVEDEGDIFTGDEEETPRARRRR